MYKLFSLFYERSGYKVSIRYQNNSCLLYHLNMNKVIKEVITNTFRQRIKYSGQMVSSKKNSYSKTTTSTNFSDSNVIYIYSST